MTGTLEECQAREDELRAANAIEVDSIGLQLVYYQLAGFSENPKDQLYTIYWQPCSPKAKKERRQPSLRKMEVDGEPFGLHPQPCDGGYEIIRNRGKYERLAFAKTRLGIRRKLTQMINQQIVDDCLRRAELDRLFSAPCAQKK
jgi:hypothetical protein